LGGGVRWCRSVWGGASVDGGSVHAFLAAALTRVMRATVPIPSIVAGSVMYSAVVGDLS